MFKVILKRSQFLACSFLDASQRDRRDQKRREKKERKKKKEKKRKEKKRNGTKRRKKGKERKESGGRNNRSRCSRFPWPWTDDYGRLPPTRRATRRPLTFDDRSRKRFARVPHTDRPYLFMLTSWPIRSRVMELLARTPDRTLIAGRSPLCSSLCVGRIDVCSACVDLGGVPLGLFGSAFNPPLATVRSFSRRRVYGRMQLLYIHRNARANGFSVYVRAAVVVHRLAVRVRGQTRSLTAVSASTRRVRARFTAGALLMLDESSSRLATM